MKKIIYSFIALGALAISSCTSDPCKDKTSLTLCSGNGTAVASGDNCVCNCNSGFEGTNCLTLSAAKFVASYKGSITSGGITLSNQNTSIALSSVDQVKVLFTMLSNTLTGTVSGSTITFASQVINNKTYSGSATLASDGKTLSFSINETGATTNTYTSSDMTKQ